MSSTTMSSLRQMRAMTLATEASTLARPSVTVRLSRVNQLTFMPASMTAWARASTKRVLPVPEGRATAKFWGSVHPLQGAQAVLGGPLGVGAKTFAYDALSRLATVTDAKGQKTTLTHDAFDRLTKATFADGSSVTYTYDAAGRLTRRDDAAGATVFSYDALGRPIAKTVGGVTQNATYDGVANLTSLADPGGTVRYTYDQVNLLSSLTEPDGRTPTFSYDVAGRRTSATCPNGVSRPSPRPSGRQTRITGKGPSVLSSLTPATPTRRPAPTPVCGTP